MSELCSHKLSNFWLALGEINNQCNGSAEKRAFRSMYHNNGINNLVHVDKNTRNYFLEMCWHGTNVRCPGLLRHCVCRPGHCLDTDEAIQHLRHWHDTGHPVTPGTWAPAKWLVSVKNYGTLTCIILLIIWCRVWGSQIIFFACFTWCIIQVQCSSA